MTMTTFIFIISLTIIITLIIITLIIITIRISIVITGCYDKTLAGVMHQLYQPKWELVIGEWQRTE